MLAHALNLPARLVRVDLLQLDLDILALPHVLDAFESERAERVLNGLALGLQNPLGIEQIWKEALGDIL